jgi:hypothetical protein
MFGKIKKFLRNFNLKENNRPLIFLVCLMIATVLWLVKALEKQYESTISMPVQYTNLPQNKELATPPPSRLVLKLKAHGFTLLRHKFGLTITPINFNVKLFTNNALDNKESTDFYVIPDKYISQISNQISPEITILDISPDTIFFQFNKPSVKEDRISDK